LLQIIPALVVASLYIGGKAEFGVVTQSSMAFAHLVGAFSLIITQFSSLSSYAAVISRLGVLDEAMERAQSQPVHFDEVCPHHCPTSTCPWCSTHPAPPSAIEVADDGGEGIVRYERLTLLDPSDGRFLLRELSGTVAPGARLLILG